MTLTSTAPSHDERSGSAPQQPDYVRTIKETAAILGIGEPSLRVMLAKGEGPQMTRISPRRIGIRDSHRTAWLNARALSQPA